MSHPSGFFFLDTERVFKHMWQVTNRTDGVSLPGSASQRMIGDFASLIALIRDSVPGWAREALVSGKSIGSQEARTCDERYPHG